MAGKVKLKLEMREDAPTNLTYPEVAVLLKTLEKIDANITLLRDDSAYLSLSQNREPQPYTEDPQMLHLSAEEYLSLRIAMLKIRKGMYGNNIQQLESLLS